MPIRFECVHCGKRLGIARRKAGAVVTCPTCHKQLIVPTPSEEELQEAENRPVSTEPVAIPAGSRAASTTRGSAGASPPASAPPESVATPPPASLLERSDFDEVLKRETVKPSVPPPLASPLSAPGSASREPALPPRGMVPSQAPRLSDPALEKVLATPGAASKPTPLAAALGTAPLPLAPSPLTQTPDPFLGSGPPPLYPPGFYLSPNRATWLVVLAVILLAIAFGAGVLVGHAISSGN